VVSNPTSGRVLNRTRGMIYVDKIKKLGRSSNFPLMFNRENIKLWSLMIMTYIDSVNMDLS